MSRTWTGTWMRTRIIKSVGKENKGEDDDKLKKGQDSLLIHYTTSSSKRPHPFQ